MVADFPQGHCQAAADCTAYHVAILCGKCVAAVCGLICIASAKRRNVAWSSWSEVIVLSISSQLSITSRRRSASAAAAASAADGLA